MRLLGLGMMTIIGLMMLAIACLACLTPGQSPLAFLRESSDCLLVLGLASAGLGRWRPAETSRLVGAASLIFILGGMVLTATSLQLELTEVDSLKFTGCGLLTHAVGWLYYWASRGTADLNRACS